MLNHEIHNCTRCPLSKLIPDYAKPLGGTGHKNKLFIITEHPTIENMVLQDHKVGLAQTLLIDKFLPDCGITKYYITSTVKCCSDTAYKKKEIVACSNWLSAELNEVRPKGIIMFGGLCLKSINVSEPLKVCVYKEIQIGHITLPPFKAFVNYSPNYLLQSGQKKYDEAVKKTKDFIKQL